MPKIKHSEIADAARRGLRPKVIKGRAEVDSLPPGPPLVAEPSLREEIKDAKGRLEKIEKGVKKP